MFVVADTTPLNYLVLLGEINILHRLYGSVIIPQAVLQELNHARTPSEVRIWAAQLPTWCEVRSPASIPDRELDLLDPGERDAIQIALDDGYDTLLMDEMKGRREAQRRGLRVAGTLSILEVASQFGWLDFPPTLNRLEQLGFRLSSSLRIEFLSRNPQR